MDGIILTTPVGSGGGGGNSDPIEDTVAGSATEIVDTVLANPCPIIKWLVSIHNTTTDDVKAVELNAVHDFGGNVTFSTAYLLGDEFDVQVTAIAGGGSDEIDLQIENNLGVSVDICAFRIIQ